MIICLFDYQPKEFFFENTGVNKYILINLCTANKSAKFGAWFLQGINFFFPQVVDLFWVLHFVL